jgi:hypothetical protein
MNWSELTASPASKPKRKPKGKPSPAAGIVPLLLILAGGAAWLAWIVLATGLTVCLRGFGLGCRELSRPKWQQQG